MQGRFLPSIIPWTSDKLLSLVGARGERRLRSSVWTGIERRFQFTAAPVRLLSHLQLRKNLSAKHLVIGSSKI